MGLDSAGHVESLGMKVSVTVPPWVRLAGTGKHKFQPRPSKHSTKPTCWVKAQTFPSSQKLRDMRAAQQVCLQSS